MIAELLENTPLPWMAATFMKPGEDSRKWAVRRGYAIHAYVGANGGGKSLAMVHDTIPSLRAGRPVLSTVRLVDFDDPRACGDDPLDVCDDPENHERLWGDEWVTHAAAHPGYVPFRDFAQLMTFESGDVLMDEVTGVASSRESHAMPAPVVNWLQQLRRKDVLLRWTAPNWARADKVIREVTQAVTSCRGSSPVTANRADGTDRLWRDRRMFRWTTFDAFDFDEFSSAKRDAATPLSTQWYWRPGHLAGQAYDTFDPVQSLSVVDDAGRCLQCGKKRPQEMCHGHDENGEALPRPTRRSTTRSGQA